MPAVLTEKTVAPLGALQADIFAGFSASGQMESLAPAIPSAVTSPPLTVTLVGPLIPVVSGMGKGEREKIANSLSNYLYIALFPETTVLPYCWDVCLWSQIWQANYVTALMTPEPCL